MEREQVLEILRAQRGIALGGEKRAQTKLARKGQKDPTYWAMCEKVERENAEALAVAIRAVAEWSK